MRPKENRLKKNNTNLPPPVTSALQLTGAQQAAGGRLGRGRGRGQALVAGDVGEEGGEVEARALAHRGQDGRGRVGGQHHHAVGQPHRRAQVALVGGDAGVERRRDEGGRLGRRDDEGLGPRPALQPGPAVLVQARVALPVLGGGERRGGRSGGKAFG